MPSFLAIAAGPSVALSCLICAASMLTGRPRYLPAAFALAMPSLCRSSMISRSQVATPARIVSMSLLVGLRVSNRLAARAQDHQADATLREVGLDGQQFGCAACQPVRLGDGQHVALAQECETLVQFRPLRHAGHQFAEYLLRACGLQVALLRGQAGRLIPGGCPRISD